MFVVSSVATALSGAPASSPIKKPFGLVLHGGAFSEESYAKEHEPEYRRILTEARDRGYAILEGGGSALDAVVGVIMMLEDSPLFNAGKGAVLTADGVCELDASIMDGRNQAAGAVAGVRRIKNPITLSRAVMEHSNHVMLSGSGAEAFAQQRGFALVDNEYFQTPFRRAELERVQTREAAAGVSGKKSASLPQPAAKFGTVGCAALDREGNLAAGTSTGGMMNKRYGRVGDSPIIGAGTYANNATCAVSATGWGEYFIRVSVAHDISAQLEYSGAAMGEAANATLAKVAALGGSGGVVCIDKDANIALPFNTIGMYRAYRLSNGTQATEVFAK